MCDFAFVPVCHLHKNCDCLETAAERWKDISAHVPKAENTLEISELSKI